MDPVQARKRIGMVFQKPNPFPKSIYDNIAFGPRVLGMKGDMDEIVEQALRRGALWDEVKDRLKSNAFGMSGGQQQRLCIARCLAIEPDVILMDEPCSALDPISTGRIEDLMIELRENYSIVIVTHNMQQAARVSDMTAFFTVEVDARTTAASAGWSSTTTPRRSSRPRPTRARRRTSPARSADGPQLGNRLHFQEEMQQLEEQALERARPRGARRSTACARRSQHQDIELAEMVIADDDLIDGLYLQVHQGVLSLLALQAPVATDLRLVAAVLDVIKHIERMGDQCVNVAKMIPLAGHEPPRELDILTGDRPDGAQAKAQVLQAGQAFRSRDVALAEDLVRQDDEIDKLNREVFRLALEVGDDADTREWAMTMMLMARAIERIGDNAVDIGEQVAFVVTGLFREFTDASHPEAVPPSASLVLRRHHDDPEHDGGRARRQPQHEQRAVDDRVERVAVAPRVRRARRAEDRERDRDRHRHSGRQRRVDDLEDQVPLDDVVCDRELHASAVVRVGPRRTRRANAHALSPRPIAATITGPTALSSPNSETNA